MPRQYADIAFPTAVRRVFTYDIPDHMIVKAGMRVWIPLRNEKSIGMVVRVHDRIPDFKTKSVLRVLDDHPVLDETLLDLTEWIHRFYYCSWGEVIQSALPVGLNFVSEKCLKVHNEYQGQLDDKERDMLHDIEVNSLNLSDARKRWKDYPEGTRLKGLLKKGCLEIWEQPRQKIDYKTVKHWDWLADKNGEHVQNLIRNGKDVKWIQALKELLNADLPAPHRDLLEGTSMTDYTLRRIEDEGIIKAIELPVIPDRFTGELYEPDSIVSLSEDQEAVYTAIRNSMDQQEFMSWLLYGVTGSGKTEVYIYALKHALSKGRGGMVLVPEIALTPQTVRRFFRIFGDQIAVIHSRQNDRERFEAWEGLRSGDKKIVIGPRSAVFAPVQNLGIIVVDEEHDSSYKQFDPAPRYHARDVAIMRANMEKAVVVMGSATPSIVALQGVKNKKHQLLQLPLRPTGDMPEINILDMKQYRSAMRGALTVELYDAIKGALDRNEQIILLYNRRGYSSYLLCEACGHIPQSPECSVSLTYHKKKNMLLCHYSGYARKADQQCEQCGSDELAPQGSGTQQIEEEISGLFPDARIVRMDRDTTSSRYAHQQIYRKFLNGESEILIGTQIVAKGLDFPNVTVVGVLNAETELAFPSFRSGERMYQLISQVAGRAGRGSKSGFVYVQTWKPEHRSIQYAKHHDYWSFAKEELSQRNVLSYPPFSRMIVFQFKASSLNKAEKVAHSFTDALREETTNQAVLGPTPSVIEWMHGNYQWEASIKIKPEHHAMAVESLLNRVFERYEKQKLKGAGTVRINVNVDAIE